MIPATTSPFGYIPTSEMPTRPVEWLEFNIPRDTMRMSEARAWADFQAAQWAEVRRTKIVGIIDWKVDGLRISALATLTLPPKKVPSRKPPKPPTRKSPMHDECVVCEDLRAYPQTMSDNEIAAVVPWGASTIRRHRLSIDKETPA